MIQRWSLALLGTMLAGATVRGAAAQTVQACPNPANCIQVSVGSDTVNVNDTASIDVNFAQGPANAQSGGTDEIAALAFTLDIGSKLQLADCSIGSDGLPAAVSLNPIVQNFRVVVENATCANGRTHCLCPESGSGITPDGFINLVVYGPNPLPTPGPNPVDIPILPAGPQTLLSIHLKGTAPGSTPLHIYTESANTSKPQFTAYLSVGDRLAVDQTCVPVSGQPPCSSAGSVSQVAITDGSVTVNGQACIGDCSSDNEVTVDELLKMVNIALGTAPLSQCPVADPSGDGEVTVDEIIQAVNIALTSCPGA